MVTEFFMAMDPPTCTHQEKQVHVVKGKPVFYEPQELKAARQKLLAYLAGYRPEEKYGCGIRLVVKWCFPRGRHRNGDKARYGQSSEAPQGLHDRGRILEG